MAKEKFQTKKAESTTSGKGHIEVIERELVRVEQIPADVTIQCLCGHSTKAALKAGQGTRLTKISKFVEKTNNNILQTSDLQVVTVKIRHALQGSGKSTPSSCCRLLKGQTASL